MFTVEFDFDRIKIMSLDETGEHDELEVYLSSDHTVFLVQRTEGHVEQDCIAISYPQLLDIISALQQTEGTYKVERTAIN